MQIVFVALAAIATTFAPNPVPACLVTFFSEEWSDFDGAGVALRWTGPVIIVRWPSEPGG